LEHDYDEWLRSFANRTEPLTIEDCQQAIRDIEGRNESIVAQGKMADAFIKAVLREIACGYHPPPEEGEADMRTMLAKYALKATEIDFPRWHS
jgi:hypothetical protein